MEHLPEESRDSLYQTYTTPAGMRYIVLEGLSPEEIPTPPYLQQRIHEHGAYFSLFYWCILVASLAYITYTYIGSPIWKRSRAH